MSKTTPTPAIDEQPTWRSRDGAPYPLGVSYVCDEDALNFALYSKHADAVALHLYSADDIETPLRSVDLHLRRNRSGRIWHCRLPCAGLEKAKYYAYTVDGPKQWRAPDFHAFDADKILLDPYAAEVYCPPGFDRASACRPGSNAGKAALGRLCSRREGPQARRCHDHIRHDADLVIYELHVRGFTQHPSSPVPDSQRGSYGGVAAMIPYLVSLGITAVELMPVFQHDPDTGDFWGYSPMSFFAPHVGFAASQTPDAAVTEFREMVDALHAADIEVLLDVVYNHTAEGGAAGPNYSFKGLDNSTYYLCSPDPAQPYLDYAGTGNTLHCANRQVRRMILDSLRHWVTQMHVDGFRFDLASIFARDSQGTLAMGDDAAPLFSAIVGEPSLAHARLIAEPWDAVGTDQLGRNFPGIEWHQWNGRFRDDARRFVRGDAGLVPALMRRMYGSDDLFPDRPPDVFRPYQSINYVTAHDGFTLYDLVAYQHKRNWANGHDNTDGPSRSFSCNYGHEGDDGVPSAVLALRQRQAKNLMAVLLLANGVPMLRAGDEFLNTQGGNDNPYNQDNETSWLDWRRLAQQAEMHRFVCRLIAFRKRHPTLCRSLFWRDDVQWFGGHGSVDLSPDSHSFGYYLRGTAEGDADLYVVLNMGPTALPVTLQVGLASEWRRVIDTARPAPRDIIDEASAARPVGPGDDGGIGDVESRSVVVWVR